MKRAIIASTSTLYGNQYLQYLLDEIDTLFKSTTNIVFIPYARPKGISHTHYTQKVAKALSEINKTVVGIHEFKNPVSAIQHAEALFVGGGNTFLLLEQLYKNNLINPLKTAVNNNTPYLGTSAGSNICGPTIKTTNDMPIVSPPTFNALGIIPFNINAHYLDSEPNSKHMGETRTTRIQEFHQINTPTVVGLREGSWLQVTAHNIRLKGPLTARIFERNKKPYEVNTGTTLNTLK